MRRALFAPFLALLLSGCGNPDAEKAQSPIPRPQPGVNPASLPPTTLRFINQSSVEAAEFGAAVGLIEHQLVVDLNPRWGCNGHATIEPGPGPSIFLQDRADGPGGYTEGDTGLGYVAYRENTRATWRAYLSHVAINLITGPDYLAGQSVEQYDYRSSDYAEQPPWELADFDFPSRHGLGGQYFDHAGRPAHDLLSRLPYP